MKFEELGLSEQVLQVINEEKFEKPSEIQEKTIPLVLEGKDVIAGSKTGSGKTLAFGAGILHSCKKGQGIQAVVLTPTRELAEQVAESLRLFSKYDPLKIVSVYGGVSINPQIDNLHTADVVVATPGRMLDHMERRTIDLSKVKIVVLDEADRMLDMGFIEDVEQIIGACAQERQTLLFSATVMPELADLARRYMKEPTKVSVESFVDAKKLPQSYYNVPDNRKFSLLVHLLKEEKGHVMVFCNSRMNVDFVVKNLKLNGIPAQAMHGGMSQVRRSSIIKEFDEQKLHVLVCTDVAARGLHIEGVSHVYNYDIPKESKQYIHRIGRTARAGQEGMAINILTSRDHENFDRVQRDFAVDIKQMDTPRTERVTIQRVERRDDGRGFGQRGGFNRGPPRGGRGFGQQGGFGRGPSRGGSSRGPPRGGSRSPSAPRPREQKRKYKWE